jgi:hypothetical protein
MSSNASGVALADGILILNLFSGKTSNETIAKKSMNLTSSQKSRQS